MKSREADYTLEFLLDFDGRIHHLKADYWLKFEIKRVNATPRRPHGSILLIHSACAGWQAIDWLITLILARPKLLGSRSSRMRGITGTAPNGIRAGHISSKTLKP